MGVVSTFAASSATKSGCVAPTPGQCPRSGLQQTASGVDKPPAGFQPRRAVQNGGLFGTQFLHRLGRLAPFQVGVAAQGAAAPNRAHRPHTCGPARRRAARRARRAHAQSGRIDIGQAAACHVRLQGVQPAARRVKRDNRRPGPHRRTQSQGQQDADEVPQKKKKKLH